MDQATPADNSSEMVGLDIIVLQLIEDVRFPELILLANPGIRSQVLGVWYMVFPNTSFLPSKTAIFVDVEPGLITRICSFITLSLL